MTEPVMPAGVSAEEAAAAQNWEAIRGRIGNWGDSVGRKAFGMKGDVTWGQHFSNAAMQSRLVEAGYLTKPGRFGVTRALAKGAGQGWLSAFFPVSPPIPAGGAKAGSKILSALPKALRAPVGMVGRTALKWLGPVITTYRLATETKGLGTIGKIDKSARILGEEGAWAAGAGIGAVLGSVVPGIGTIGGMIVGAGIGYVGSKAWNFGLDVAEAPIRMAARGWNALEAKGRQAKRLELGGRVSLGNTTSAAATMRQRAIGEIYRSGINQRSILGREASYMHTR
jgi:hypothetical protein